MSDTQANLSTATSNAPSVSAHPTGTGAMVTVVLIATNVVVFVLMAIFGVGILDASADGAIKWGANYGPMTLGGQWWRLFTAQFVHFGLIHLLCNMVVLANIGPFLESLLGTRPYLVLYLVAGLGGAAASLAWHPTTVSAGASGAIFGLYGALFALLLRGQNAISREALAPLKKGAIVFVGYNLLYGMANPRIDMVAHVGGLAAGFMGGLLLAPPESGKTSDGQTVAVIVCGAVIAAATLLFVPRPVDFQEALARMSQIEERALATFNSAVEKWKAHQVSNEQFTATLETDVLPQWRAERTELSNLKGLTGKQKQLAREMVRYMATRQKSWELLADGVRTNDIGKIESSRKKNEEADQIAQNPDLKSE